MLVEPDLSVPGFPEVFVVGDMAAARFLGKDANEDDTWVPGVAQGALQGGTHAGRIIARELNGADRSQRSAFRYHDKGSMATIGRASAVAEIGRFKFGGFVAWVLWGLVHVMFLVEFRNRVGVMLGWFWNWITFTRGARLITGGRHPGDEPAPPRELEPEPEPAE